jgi:hypothetical protein
MRVDRSAGNALCVFRCIRQEQSASRFAPLLVGVETHWMMKVRCVSATRTDAGRGEAALDVRLNDSRLSTSIYEWPMISAAIAVLVR